MNKIDQTIIAIYGKMGEEWLHHLPSYIDRLKVIWNLKDLHPMQELSYNYVFSGYRDSIPVILKVTLETKNLNQEKQALSLFQDYGAVPILESHSNALLLQKAEPGISLKSRPVKEESILIACKAIEKLQQTPYPKEKLFPDIEEWLADLDKEWNIPKKHLETTRNLKNRLLRRNKSEKILLHGDLHRGNILSHETDWLIIDPKGVVGFPINEVWACVEDIPHDLPFIADYFHYSFQNVVQWYYVHLILAACWQVKDQGNPSLYLKLADKVELEFKKWLNQE